MKRRECKELAKNILKGQWLIGTIVLLIEAGVITILATTTASIGVLLLQSVITIAVYNVYINGYAGKKYEISDMLTGVTDELTNRICLSVLKNIFIFLYTISPHVIIANTFVEKEKKESLKVILFDLLFSLIIEVVN